MCDIKNRATWKPQDPATQNKQKNVGNENAQSRKNEETMEQKTFSPCELYHEKESANIFFS